MSLLCKEAFVEGAYYIENETFKATRGRAAYLFVVKEFPCCAHEANEKEIKEYDLMHTWIWQMIEKHLPLCYDIAKKFHYDSDSMVHDVGIPMMLHALKTFNPKRGAFTSYIYRLLHSRYSRYVYIATRMELINEFPSSVLVECPQLDDEEMVLYLMNCLSEYERHIVILYYWKGLNYQEIGDLIGCAKSTALRQIKKALEKMKRYGRFSARQSSSEMSS